MIVFNCPKCNTPYSLDDSCAGMTYHCKNCDTLCELPSQNSHQTINVLEKAAEQGDANAQNRLGDYYSWGYGVSEDSGKAAYWYEKAFNSYKKAAEQDDVDAQWRLGFCYSEGRGVPKDLKIGVYWYQKAAGQGDVCAQKVIKEKRKEKIYYTVVILGLITMIVIYLVTKH